MIIKCKYCRNRKENACYCGIVKALKIFAGRGFLQDFEPESYKYLQFHAPNILNEHNDCEWHKPTLTYKLKLLVEKWRQ